MFSSRTSTTDTPHADEGLRSHHLSDGLTQVMVTGEEYQEIFGLWDWKKLPGVTSVQNGDFRREEIRTTGQASFVGGVSDGMHGMAAMDLRRREIEAKLARFYFEDEVVVLGAGIRSRVSRHPVFTTLDQTYLRSPVTTSLSEREIDKGVHSLPPLEWIHHNRVGYAFFEPTTLFLQNALQSGSWNAINPRFPDEPVTDEVFSLWLDHGQAVRDARYAYILVPGVDRAGMEAWSSRRRVAVLSNTPALQAVAHGGLRMIQAAFRKAGEVTGGELLNLRVKANRPCLLLLREGPGALRIAAANPENEPATLELEVNRVLSGENVLRAGQSGSAVRLELPGGRDAGSTIVRDFRMVQGRNTDGLRE